MARRIFLHIGAPKTGTTYLQTVMWNNRPGLAQQGLLYPGRRRMDHHDATVVVREKQPPGRSDGGADAWHRLTSAARGWAGDAVITHEFFGAATAAQAARAIEQLAPAEVHLVFTVRDYISQVPAYWQEAVKVGYPHGLGEYTRAFLADDLNGAWSWLTMDATAILDRWSATLPPGRMHVITVPRRGAPRDLLWRRYAGVLGLDPACVDLDKAQSNESMGLAQAELLRRVGQQLGPELGPVREKHRWLREELGHKILVPQGGARFGVRRDEAEALRDLSAKVADHITARGFDVVGDVSELVPEELPDLPHPDDVSDDEVLSSAYAAMARLLERFRTVSKDRERLRRRVRRGRRFWRLGTERTSLLRARVSRRVGALFRGPAHR